MKKILLSFAAIVASVSVNAQVDTITEFFTGTPTLYGVSGQPGFVSGNNGYGDLGKYMRFNAFSGTGTMTGVLLWVPVKVDNGGSMNVKVINFAGGVAGADLASVNVPLSAVDTSLAAFAIAEGTTPYNVSVTFPTAVPLTSASDVLVGVALPTTAGDTIALVSNTDGDYMMCSTNTWEQWNDLTYNDVNTAWSGLNIAWGVFPVINGITAGLTEEALQVRAYPNPAATELNIATGNPAATSVSIISMDGKVVATQSMTGAVTNVSVAELMPGVYFFEVASDNGEVIIRNSFVKK